MAADAGLDLVEIAPNADPPVCKVLDFGKFKYEEQRKRTKRRKKQKIIEVKEIKLRPSIDDHDYDVKLRSMVKFLEEGDESQSRSAVPWARTGASRTRNGRAGAGA